MTDTERLAFEKWCYLSISDDLRKDDDGSYISFDTYSTWFVWQAAWQALTQGQVVYQLLSNDGTWTDTVKEVYDIPSEVKRRVLYTHLLVVTDEIGEVRENGVVWFDQNPHAYPVGTKFYAALQKQLR